MPKATTLALVDAVPLLTAQVALRARRAGVRLLAIKGPSLALQELREPKVSTDVDVLTEWGQRDAIVTAMVAQGWSVLVESDAPRVRRLHSVTLVHDSWPCHLDIHDEYPGFFATPSETFEALWRGRTTLELAGVQVDVPHRAHHAAILAAHAIRNDRVTSDTSELGLLVTRWSSTRADQDDAALVTFLQESRGISTLRAFTSRVGVDPGGEDITELEAIRWRRSIAAGGRSSVHWWAAWHDAPWWRKPSVAVRALRRVPGVARATQGTDGWSIRTPWGFIRYLYRVARESRTRYRGSEGYRRRHEEQYE